MKGAAPVYTAKDESRADLTPLWENRACARIFYPQICRTPADEHKVDTKPTFKYICILKSKLRDSIDALADIFYVG